MNSTALIEYLPTSGHVCTSCVDALLPDELDDYRGRHRADMAIGGALSHELLALTGAAGPWVASCGSYLPGQPFRVSREAEPHSYRPRHVSRTPSQAYYDYTEGALS